LAGEKVEQRLARTLLMLCIKLGPTLPFTRQEIADMVGTTTETAIRVMSHLKDRGIIRSTRGKTVIIDELKLRLISEGLPQF
jgi:CRP/FNR family transcriptional regulator